MKTIESQWSGGWKIENLKTIICKLLKTISTESTNLNSSLVTEYIYLDVSV